MKTAGVVFVTLAVLVAAGFCLIGQSVTVLGTDVSCGTPVGNLTLVRDGLNDVDASVAAACQDQNEQQVATGVILGLITLVAGLLMLGAAERQERAELVASGAVSAAEPRSVIRGIGRKLAMVAAVFVIGGLLVVLLASV